MSAGISDVDRRTRGFKASLMRFRAAFIKELIQLRRDRITFAMMIMIPLLQLMLFGYAINTSPRHLPTAVLVQDDSAFARSFLAAMRATDYFDISASAASEEELDRLILSGKVLFGVQIPAHFGRDLMRGARPALLVVADAADPTATGSAIAALQGLSSQVFSRELTGPAANLAPRPLPYELRVHQRYNPAGETRLNIVPGLMGLILTLTMLIFTALSVTREIERGTMESLLAMPIRPVEIMLGKIAPYLLVGGVQMTIILVAARLLFGIPVIGSRPSPRISFKRCRCRFSSSCPTSCCPGSCSRSKACRAGRRRSARSCPSPTICASFAGSCSKARPSPICRPMFWLSPPSPCLPWA
jgi:ABC-2 type transport system permease protein